MAKPVRKCQLDDKKEHKSPKEPTPVICYDSQFAEDCGESMIEEVMEMTEDVCMEEMQLEVSQENPSSEEEQTSSPTIPAQKTWS